jgi:carbonic anhydrase
MHRFVVAACLLLFWSQVSLIAQVPGPAAAWQRLKDGNARFIENKLAPRDTGTDRRKQLAGGQQPFAVILSCSDSRVVPEFVFDQGLGDLFIIRVAGNVTDSAVVGSIEYAVEHLHCPLVVLLGHQNCGAVEAALKGEKLPGDLGWLIRHTHVPENLPADPKAALAAAVRSNIQFVAQELVNRSAIVHELVSHDRLLVQSAYYSLDNGKVEWLGPHGTK